MNKCPDYVGVTCINGSCPLALYEVNPDYFDIKPSCKDCGFYKGCKDCAFADVDGKCAIDKKLHNGDVVEN